MFAYKSSKKWDTLDIHRLYVLKLTAVSNYQVLVGDKHSTKTVTHSKTALILFLWHSYLISFPVRTKKRTKRAPKKFRSIILELICIMWQQKSSQSIIVVFNHNILFKNGIMRTLPSWNWVWRIFLICKTILS